MVGLGLVHVVGEGLKKDAFCAIRHGWKMDNNTLILIVFSRFFYVVLTTDPPLSLCLDPIHACKRHIALLLHLYKKNSQASALKVV